MQAPWGNVEVSDAHAHFFSRCFFASLGEPAEIAAKLNWTLPPDDPAELARTWAAELDRQGVSRSALIASVPGDAASVGAALAAVPGRFYGYAMTVPGRADDPLPFANGLQVACLFPGMHCYSLHDPEVQPILAAAACEPGRAVFIHCGVLTVGARKKLGLPSPFDMRFSNPLEIHALALRYPHLPFIVPHFGAGMFREALMLADLCPNVYLDTSSSNSWMRYEGLDLVAVFRRALDVAGPSRLLFGTDSSFFPRGWNRAIFDVQAAALSELGIGAADAALIFGKNLERILTPAPLS
jgi:hypothetical protein